MFTKWRPYLPFTILIFFSMFLFRSYIFKGLVPFPANLLVATYEPWRSYPVPEYPNGPVNKPMGFDNIRIYYPLKKVALDAMKQLQPPLWNPYNFTGNTILATYQSALFHPLSFLYLVLPQIHAWSIIIVLQPILAFAAMYMFLSVIGMSKSARFFGSMTYAFSGFFVVWWEEAFMFTYSALFLPVALSAVELYLTRKHTKWLVLLAASLALSVVSGAFQMTFYVYAFTAIWILYRTWHIPDKFRLLILFCISAAISFLLSAAHLLPSMEGYYYSARISNDAKYIFDANLLPFWQLITLLAPDYFGNPATYNYFGLGFYHERMLYFGVTPLIFVLMQLLRPSKSKHTKFFIVTFLITLSLTFALPTTWALLYYLKLPLLSTMTPSRIVMLSMFAASVLTAYGIEEYWKGIHTKSLIFITIVLVMALISAGIAPFYIHYLHPKIAINMISLRNLVIPVASIMIALGTLFVTRANARLKTVGFIALSVLLLFNAYIFANKFLYFSETRFIYPKTPVISELKRRINTDRFWTYENGYLEKNFASYMGLYSPEGYDSIMIRRYGEFLNFADTHGKDMMSPRADALLQSTDHINTILTDSYRKKVLELLDVRYILQKMKPDRSEPKLLPDPPNLPTVWQDGTYAIHEYANTVPHAALYRDIRIIPDKKTLLTALFDDKTDIHRTLFLEQPPLDVPLISDATGSATITDYSPNSVSISSITTQAMMLFLSDAYYPGWNAYVDGIKTPVYRADYAFRAVAVPKGNHSVVFKYEPWSWTIGILGSFIGILVCIYLVRSRHS